MQTYRIIHLSAAWPHEPMHDVSLWACSGSDRPAMSGRAAFCIHTGAVTLSLNPTPDELRTMAAAMLAVADAQDRIDDADRPASLDGLTVTEIAAARVPA